MKRVLGFVAMLISACGSSTPDNAEGGGGRSAVAVGGGSGSGGSAPTIDGASGTGAGAGCLTGDIDLLVTRVSGTVTLNGAAIADAASQIRLLLNLRQGARDYARLTGLSGDGSSFSALVVRGTYDLQLDYSSVPGSPIFNTAVLQRGIVVGAEPLSLNIDVPLATVSGTITVNGAALTTANSPCSLSLRNAAGDFAGLTPSLPDGGGYSVSVAPGSYDLYCQVTAGPRLELRSGIVVGTSPLALDIDVPVTTIATRLTVNGAAITDAGEEQAVLTLKNEAGAGVRVWSHSTADATARIVAGTYDVYLTGDRAGVAFPANESAKVRSGLVVGSSRQSLELDIPVSTVSGTVTVNGAAITDSATRTFRLRGAAGDQVTLTVTAASYATRIIPGTYDLYYAGAFGGVNVPSFKLRSGIVIGPSDLRLDIDLPTPTTVSGTVTMNGAPITPSNQEFSLYLLNAADDRVSLTSSPDGGVYSALAFPGTYDLFYADRGDRALERPSNSSAKIRTGIVVGSSPLALDIDIPGSTFSGTVSVNGVARRDLASDPLAFTLRDERDAYAPIAFSRSGTGYSSFVVPGTYQLEYLVYGDGREELPRNTNVNLGCFIVP